MLLLFLLFSSLPETSSSLINATLTIFKYTPPTFLLTFTQIVQRPAFQLLLNNFNVVKYHFADHNKQSDNYIIIADQISSNQQDLQIYSILFNFPSAIGPKRLNSNCYLIHAIKQDIVISFSDSIGILVVVISYLLVYFTTLGHIVIQFLQIYCLLRSRNHFKTTIYEKISAGMFLLYSEKGGDAYDYTAMLFPMFIIILTGSLGYLLKNRFNQKKSLVERIFYEVGVYNIFINVTIVFIFPLFFNSLQFFNQLRLGLLQEGHFMLAGTVISYLNVVLTVSLIYLFIYALNPKCKQSQESWQRYISSQSFDNYRKLYEGLYLNFWYKRNKIIITIIKRMLVALLYFWSESFEEAVFLLEFATILYVFTLRPYKSQIFLYSAVISRLLLFCFYGAIILGNLYFNLGRMTASYSTIETYLNSTIGIFLGIVFFIFLFIFYEMYIRFNDLSYKIRLVKQQNYYKIKFIEKEDHSKRRSQRDNRKRRNEYHCMQDQICSSLRGSHIALPLNCLKSSFDVSSKRNSSDVKSEKKVRRLTEYEMHDPQGNINQRKMSERHDLNRSMKQKRGRQT